MSTDNSNQIVVAVAGIEKLHEGNWWAWKQHITQQFKKLGYTKYFSEDEPPKPANPAKPMSAEIADTQKWQSNDADALLILMKTVLDNELCHITGAETTSEVWAQLRAAKEAQTLDAIVDAQATLHDIKVYKGQPMAEHIANLQRAATELWDLGEPYPDNRFAMVISALLPKSWRQFTQSYWAGKTINDIKSIRSSDLIMQILQEEQAEKKADATELANHAVTSYSR